MRKVFLVVFAAALTTSSAYAADLPSRTRAARAPVVPRVPLHSWTGAYVGISAGFADTSNRWTDDSNWIGNYGEGALGSSGGMPSYEGFSKSLGFQLGYNFVAKGNLLLGLEADYNYSGGKIGANLGNAGDPYSFHSQLKSYGTLRVKFGAFAGQNLIYATGGLAVGSLSQHSIDELEPLWNKNRLALGYALGAGAERALTNHLSVKVEGMYLDFGKSAISGDPTNEASGYNASVRTSALVVRAGLNYSF